ncbi:MAG: hypothetical protein IKB88_03605 [Clostridia bacterium]|nr:hypothetical protein [Clostridia bacterium]
MAKKVTAIILSVALVFSAAFCIPSSAATEVTSQFERGFYRFVDKLLDGLVNGIAALIFEPKDWVTKDKYVSENFYEGMSADEFIKTPAADAKWSIGYANASIQTGKELEVGHYVGGSLAIGDKFATEIRDDQKVRTIAVSDGRGISIFCAIDTYGMSSSDVRGIRAAFEKEAASRNLDIDSINISALHQHSCVDTFGLNGNLITALFTASIKNLLGMELPNGQNKEFMDNLYKVTVKSMLDAIDDMKEGELYYGYADATQFIYDKRSPKVYDTKLNRLRFVPADGSEETWLLNAPIHCVGNGAAGTLITGDYPYYMEKYINETAKANVFYVLGAELAMTSEYDYLPKVDTESDLYKEYGEGYARLALFGEELAKLAISINNDKRVAPIFNIRLSEVYVPVDNSILKLAAKGGLLTNEIVKNNGTYEVVTEVGYCEFGNDIAVSIIPGELAPEIAYGGVHTAEETWDGDEWTYSSFADAAGDKTLLVFGITNDQIGYLLPSNEWHSYLTENEEIVSTGRMAGAYIAEAYLLLFDEVR